jgi:hypothetical protein
MATTDRPVSRNLAKKALEAVKQQFASYIEPGFEPKLIEGWTDSGHWAICWEEGPYEWAYNAPQGGTDEDLSALMGKHKEVEPAKDFPKEVFAEPCTSVILGLYPQF